MIARQMAPASAMLVVMLIPQIVNAASSPSKAQCLNAPVLHARPSVRLGPEELVGGIYDVGGPASRRRCTQVSPLAGKVTVSEAAHNVVVATKTVAAGRRFAIRLRAGRYRVEYGVRNGVCPHSGPITYTQPRRRTVLLDLLCQLK